MQTPVHKEAAYEHHDVAARPVKQQPVHTEHYAEEPLRRPTPVHTQPHRDVPEHAHTPMPAHGSFDPAAPAMASPRGIHGQFNTAPIEPAHGYESEHVPFVRREHHSKEFLPRQAHAPEVNYAESHFYEPEETMLHHLEAHMADAEHPDAYHHHFDSYEHPLEHAEPVHHSNLFRARKL